MTHRKAVFVVDDDPGMLRGIKRLLREFGFDAVLFDSAEAFQSQANLDDAFCVVLDVNLQNSSGIDLRKRLTTRGISLPVIFITGNDSDATRTAALNWVVQPILQSRSRRNHLSIRSKRRRPALYRMVCTTAEDLDHRYRRSILPANDYANIFWEAVRQPNHHISNLIATRPQIIRPKSVDFLRHSRERILPARHAIADSTAAIRTK